MTELNLSETERRTFDKARVQIRALGYTLKRSAIKSLLMPERELTEREPRRLVKLEGK